MEHRRDRPSMILGISAAARFRTLVAADWGVGFAAVLPAWLAFSAAARSGLGRVPEGFTPGDDRVLLLADAISGAADGLLIGAGLAVLVLWVWTVWWHAGVARALVWDRNGPSALSRILGLGLGAWWRYARLSLVALAAMLGLMAAVWLPVGMHLVTTADGMVPGRFAGWLIGAMVLSLGIKLLVWAGTLRGAWELARPDARSAAAAWIRGAFGALRHPVVSLRPIVVFGFGQGLLALGSAVVPLVVPNLRGTAAGLAAAAVVSLGASVLRVALFAAFEPVSGMVTEEA